VAKTVGGFYRLVVEGIEGVRFGYVAEVGTVDWHCFDGAVVQTEALAIVPIGEGFRWCTGALSALLFLC
jgi:hypothetical protein